MGAGASQSANVQMVLPLHKAGVPVVIGKEREWALGVAQVQ